VRAAGSLETLITANYPGCGAGDCVSSTIIKTMHCPNSINSTAYINALAKLNEYCRWLRPQAVHFDNEFYTTPNGADLYTSRITTGGSGIEGCTRCNSKAGYITGVDSVGSDISNIVRQNARNPETAIAVQYNVFKDSVTARNQKYYWNFGSDSGFIVGNPSLYYLTYNNFEPVATRGVFPDHLVDRLFQLRNGDIPGYGVVNRAQEEAIRGSYVYLSQRLDPYAADKGFLGEESMYEICYQFASEGAFGFAMWPGYSGRDKAPLVYPPGSALYPVIDIASDEAAKRLYPAGLQAFRDYYKKYTPQPLPVFPNR